MRTPKLQKNRNTPQNATTNKNPKRLIVGILAGLALLITPTISMAASFVDTTELPDAAQTTTTQNLGPITVMRSWYTAWNGRNRNLVIVYPTVPRGPLPLMISMHPATGRATCDNAFQTYPARYNFVVACLDGQGSGTRGSSYGAPGQIADTLRIPSLVAALTPGLPINPKQLIIVGSSMGGLETLLTANQNPNMFSAIVALDAPANLKRRYETLNNSAKDAYKRASIIAECGGTPFQRPSCYEHRSATSNLSNVATSATPLIIGWSTRDIIGGDPQQSPLYAQRIKQINPKKEMYVMVSSTTHGQTWGGSYQNSWISKSLGLSSRRG
jgi:poly(3-hydroxybutyrate) depolymerase